MPRNWHLHPTAWWNDFHQSPFLPNSITMLITNSSHQRLGIFNIAKCLPVARGSHPSTPSRNLVNAHKLVWVGAIRWKAFGGWKLGDLLGWRSSAVGGALSPESKPVSCVVVYGCAAFETVTFRSKRWNEDPPSNPSKADFTSSLIIWIFEFQATIRCVGRLKKKKPRKHLCTHLQISILPKWRLSFVFLEIYQTARDGMSLLSLKMQNSFLCSWNLRYSLGFVGLHAVFHRAESRGL